MSQIFDDEFAGQGGSYIVQDGKRVRIEETKEDPRGNCARDPEGRPLDEAVADPQQ